jgi:hypothetical protein
MSQLPGSRSALRKRAASTQPATGAGAAARAAEDWATMIYPRGSAAADSPPSPSCGEQAASKTLTRISEAAPAAQRIGVTGSAREST